MREHGGQDLATAVVFIAMGALALYVGWNYPMGTARAPGTGVLPRIVASGLIGVGAIIGLKALIAGGPSIKGVAWRPFFMVLLAILAFARLIDSLGLIATMAISMTLVALGTPETRWREYLAFAVLLVVIAWGMFIAALKMPIPTWPVAVPPDVKALIALVKGGAG